MNFRTSFSRAKGTAAAAIIALAMASALAGTRPALADVATAEAAFKSGDYTTALREFQGPAYRGNALAQYYMSVIYEDALGVSRSHEDSLAWLLCVRTAALPRGMRQDVERRRARISSRVSSYTLEQAKMRTAAICGKAVEPKKQAFTSTDDDYFIEHIIPERGFLGKLFFYPGDTMAVGAVFVFHKLGLLRFRDVLMAIIMMFHDLLLGVLSLIGWLIIGKVVLFFVLPFWNVMLVPGRSIKGASMSGPSSSQEQKPKTD